MKFGLKVLPKPEVLDTQGRAVQSTLQSHGFSLSDCSVGKYIVLDVNTQDPEEGKKNGNGDGVKRPSESID